MPRAFADITNAAGILLLFLLLYCGTLLIETRPLNVTTTCQNESDPCHVPLQYVSHARPLRTSPYRRHVSMCRLAFRARQASEGIGLVHYGGVAWRSDRRHTGRGGAITWTHPQRNLTHKIPSNTVRCMYRGGTPTDVV